MKKRKINAGIFKLQESKGELHPRRELSLYKEKAEEKGQAVLTLLPELWADWTCP